jgi:vacuole morphology and inheritance protein 14
MSNSVDKFRNKIMRPERGPSPSLTQTHSSWTIRPRKGTRPNGIAEEEIIKPPVDDESQTETPPKEEAPPDPLDYTLTVNALTLQFLNEYEETRLAALKWLMMLHNKVPNKILTLEDGTFPALLKTLSDDSEAVIRYDLELLSQISLRSLVNTEEEGYYFRHFMWNLLSLFGTDRNLLESRGNLIVRILCKNLNAERIFKSFAEYLEADEVS